MFGTKYLTADCPPCPSNSPNKQEALSPKILS